MKKYILLVLVLITAVRCSSNDNMVNGGLINSQDSIFSSKRISNFTVKFKEMYATDEKISEYLVEYDENGALYKVSFASSDEFTYSEFKIEDDYFKFFNHIQSMDMGVNDSILISHYEERYTFSPIKKYKYKGSYFIVENHTPRVENFDTLLVSKLDTLDYIFEYHKELVGNDTDLYINKKTSSDTLYSYEDSYITRYTYEDSLLIEQSFLKISENLGLDSLIKIVENTELVWNLEESINYDLSNRVISIATNRSRYSNLTDLTKLSNYEYNSDGTLSKYMNYQDGELILEYSITYEDKNTTTPLYFPFYGLEISGINLSNFSRYIR